MTLYQNCPNLHPGTCSQTGDKKISLRCHSTAQTFACDEKSHFALLNKFLRGRLYALFAFRAIRLLWLQLHATVCTIMAS